MVVHIQRDQIYKKLEDRSNELVNLVVTNRNGLVHAKVNANHKKLLCET